LGLDTPFSPNKPHTQTHIQQNLKNPNLPLHPQHKKKIYHRFPKKWIFFRKRDSSLKTLQESIRLEQWFMW